MNFFTYMQSEGDCVWQIPFEQATLRDRCFIGSEAVHRVMLIFQDLEASIQSARIRTRVNETMTRFGHEDLVRALPGDKGNVRRSLQTLEARGWIVIGRSPGGTVQHLTLTPEGRQRASEMRKKL